jgi:ABC-2 type transporter
MIRSRAEPGEGSMLTVSEREDSSTRASRPTRRAGEQRWIERRPSTGWRPQFNGAELWKYRKVAPFLAVRDLKLWYRQTLLGVAWVLIQPLAATALFSVVFGHLAHVPSDRLPYPVFAYSGMAAWVAVSTATQAGAMSLVDARELVTKLYFRFFSVWGEVGSGVSAETPAESLVRGVVGRSRGLCTTR